jgi:hypothetical protein
MYDMKTSLKENIFVSYVNEENSYNIFNCFLASIIFSYLDSAN